jgi:hypothetical protein
MEAMVGLDAATGELSGLAGLARERSASRESFMTDQAKDAAQGDRKYFQLEVDFSVSSRAPGHQWLNRAEQMAGFYPHPDQPFRGIRFSEPPQIRFDRKWGRTTLLDAEPFTLSSWLISDRLKILLEKLDPEAFIFQKVVVDYSNFPEPGPDYWLVYFMRMLDCVDEERSIIVYQDDVPGIKHYTALVDIKMRSEVVGTAHAFRLTHANSLLIVDDVVVAKLRAQGIEGFRFQPVQK